MSEMRLDVDGWAVTKAEGLAGKAGKAGERCEWNAYAANWSWGNEEPCYDEAVARYTITWVSGQRWVDANVLCKRHLVQATTEMADTMREVPEFIPEDTRIESL